MTKEMEFVLFPGRYWGVGLVLLLCLSLVGVVGCQPPERHEVRIGLLSDYGALEDRPSVNACKLAIEAVNDAGGLEIGGTRYRAVLIIEDTENTPEGSSRAALKLINQENVIALVGPSISRNLIPASRVAEMARVPLISPGATNPRPTAGKSFVFRVTFLDSFQSRVLARFAREELGIATAAMLYDVANAYNRGIAAKFQQAFEELGGQVVASESYTTGDQDFSLQLVRIAKREPGMLLLPNLNPEIVAQARQARRLGIDAVLVGSDGWITQTLVDHPELEGAFAIQHWHLDVAETNPEARAFLAAYRHAYGQDPSSFAALTHDALGLLFHAMKSAGRTDPESIREALSRIENYRGATGTITYRGTGGDPPKAAVIVQLRSGKAIFHHLVNPDPRR